MGKNKFYLLILILVLCTFLMIGGLCAWGILVNNNMKADMEEPQKEAPNVVVEIIKDKLTPKKEYVKDDIPINISQWDEGVSPVGALIWPLKNLELYSEIPTGTNAKELVIDTVPKGTPLVVEAEQDNYFNVVFAGNSGVIDARYCLINLPDYLGDLLEYNITNSYSSIFMAHDYILYGITDTVVTGYENINMGDGEYLVPYLYPCAKKLQPVAETVIADGYKLRIYDAFRPYVATRYIYDTVDSYIDCQVPERDENGVEMVEFDEEGNALLNKKTYPPVGSVVAYDGSIRLNDLTTIIAPAGTVTEYPIGSLIGENGAVMDETGTVLGTLYLPTENEGITNSEDLTYKAVITGGGYRLGAFLAQVSSAHNKGIALDLTLCDPETGEDLKMQSNIHDLSYHSVISNNNDNANLLAKYMKEGGFNGLSSEWWHFQDDDTRNKLGINFMLENGVSP